jgi:hypothetical protein
MVLSLRRQCPTLTLPSGEGRETTTGRLPVICQRLAQPMPQRLVGPDARVQTKPEGCRPPPLAEGRVRVGHFCRVVIPRDWKAAQNPNCCRSSAAVTPASRRARKPSA